LGKWSEQTIAEHRNRLSPFIESFQPMSNEELADAYAIARREKDRLEAMVLEEAARIRAAEMVFAERFAEDDVKTMKFNSGMALTISVEQGYTFEDKDAFVKFLEAKGWQHELTVPAGSLNRLMRDLQDAKLKPPGVKLGEPFTKFSCRGLK
jgi:hypothetical protein